MMLENKASEWDESDGSYAKALKGLRRYCELKDMDSKTIANVKEDIMLLLFNNRTMISLH